MVRLTLALALAAALLLASCGATNALRDTSARPGPVACHVETDADPVCAPCTLRCVAVVDQVPGEAPIEVESWSWGVSNAQLVHVDNKHGAAWIQCNNPGAVWIQARGVDKDGRDCTTPRHKLMASKKAPSVPVLVVYPNDAPLEGTDVSPAGKPYEWGQNAWSASESYDPVGLNPWTFSWTLSTTPADGTPPEVLVALGDGSVKPTADLDGDGFPDIVLIPGKKPGDITLRFNYLTLQPEDFVRDGMLALHLDATNALTGRKGWDGCIYGNRPPSSK